MRDTVVAKTHKESRKIACPRGHVLYRTTKNGKRFCIECRRLRDRNRKRITVNGKRVTVPGSRRL